MRTVDPFAFISEHRDTIFRWCGVLGLALTVFLLIRWRAKKMGGWRAATATVRYEIAVSAHAYAAPLRAWLRHRRSLRLLVELLGRPETWRDAEQAVLSVRPAAGAARPYAVLVNGSTATVLLAGPAPGPPVPWQADPDEPGWWTADRDGLPPVLPGSEAARPVLVSIGELDGCAAFVDLATGPAVTALEGERHNLLALLQALAAQLDVRLPEGLLTVAEGVHPGHPGQPVREAYQAALTTEPATGLAPVLAATALPDPLPPEAAAAPDGPARLRMLIGGPGRGHVRRMITDRHGQLLLPGTPLLTLVSALGPALARTLPDIPPVLPPLPDASAAGLFEEPEESEREPGQGPVELRKAEHGTAAQSGLPDEEEGLATSGPEHVRARRAGSASGPPGRSAARSAGRSGGETEAAGAAASGEREAESGQAEPAAAAAGEPGPAGGGRSP